MNILKDDVENRINNDLNNEGSKNNYKIGKKI